MPFSSGTLQKLERMAISASLCGFASLPPFWMERFFSFLTPSATLSFAQWTEDLTSLASLHLPRYRPSLTPAGLELVALEGFHLLVPLPWMVRSRLSLQIPKLSPFAFQRFFQIPLLLKPEVPCFADHGQILLTK